jgi:hypothetical protein
MTGFGLVYFFKIEDGLFWSVTLLLPADFAVNAVFVCAFVMGCEVVMEIVQPAETEGTLQLIADRGVLQIKSTRNTQSCFFLLRRRNSALTYHLPAGFVDTCIWRYACGPDCLLVVACFLRCFHRL